MTQPDGFPWPPLPPNPEPAPVPGPSIFEGRTLVSVSGYFGHDPLPRPPLPKPEGPRPHPTSVLAPA
jgi:hypothetical protein